MKLQTRILSLLMAFAFLMATTGFSVYEHYCSGNLVDLSIYTSESSCNPEGEEDCTSSNEMDCCEDHVQFVKLEIDLQKSESLVSDFPQFALAFLYSIPLVEPENGTNKDYLLDFPPIVQHSPFYIQNQQLIFYS